MFQGFSGLSPWPESDHHLLALFWAWHLLAVIGWQVNSHSIKYSWLASGDGNSWLL